MSTDPTAADDLWVGVATRIDGFDEQGLADNGLGAVHAGLATSRSSGAPDPRLAVQLLLARHRYENALGALATIVAASDQPVVLLKGLEVAQRYPEPSRRSFSDLDLLGRHPEKLIDDLRGIGYQALPDIIPDGHHHLAPMVMAAGDIPVEVHHRPGWLSWMDPPPVEQLLERVVPAETPVDGLWTLDPVDHCLFVAVHAWADGAFRRARDVLDIGVMRAGLDEAELAQRAQAWGIGRMWQATERCVDVLFVGGPPSPSTRLLLGPITKGRVRGPVTHRASVYLADFLVTSPRRAASSAIHKLLVAETLPAKLRDVGKLLGKS